MVMACRDNGTSEEVNHLKEMLRQLRGTVSMLNDQIEESFSAYSVKIKMNRFDTPNSNVSRKIQIKRSQEKNLYS